MYYIQTCCLLCMTTTVHLMFVFPLALYISLKNSAGPSPRVFWSCSACLCSSLERTNGFENAHITFFRWNLNLTQHYIEVRAALKIWTIPFFNSPVPRNIPHTVVYHLYNDSCCKHTRDRQNFLNECLSLKRSHHSSYQPHQHDNIFTEACTIVYPDLAWLMSIYLQTRVQPSHNSVTM